MKRDSLIIRVAVSTALETEPKEGALDEKDYNDGIGFSDGLNAPLRPGADQNIR